jgi:hypothetical protein
VNRFQNLSFEWTELALNYICTCVSSLKLEELNANLISEPGSEKPPKLTKNLRSGFVKGLFLKN